MCRGGGGGRGCGEGAVGAGRVDAGPVEVHVEPPAVALVPDARLLGPLRVGQALSGRIGQTLFVTYAENSNSK